jgi:fructose-1-phosphate kinase PfkB-like protein
MPWIKISSDAHKDMKQFLVDIEDLNLGELVEAAFEFCMENVEEFEKFLGLEETEDQTEQEEEAEEQQ